MFKFLKRLRQKKDEPTQAAASLIVEIQQSPTAAPVEAVVGTAETTAATARPAKSDPDLASGRAQETPETEPEIEEVAEAESSPLPEAKPAEVVEVELPKRSLGDGIRSMFSSSLDIDQLEDILLLADFGVEASVQITEDLRNAAKKAGATSDAELRLLLKDLLIGKLERTDAQLHLVDGKLPYVFLIIGVNGAGKTTTIGKLAKWLSDGEWEVVLGAADTFRAAAVEQLATWAERAGVGIIKPERDGQDPASVAYQTVEHAIESEADIAIIDTAGRLQNKKDLMDELGKIRRAVEKRAQINEVLLVIDATTGQNALSQAKAFTEVAEVTGIVMTKLDGTAKGGILYTIQRELDIPVKLVGVGEKVDDFAFFSAEEFAKGLVARKS
jgi:fused signal recognition particle receptor